MSLQQAVVDNRDYALITFDDIYYEVLKYALPVLETYKSSALLFISGAFLGRNSFWWDNLEALCASLPLDERLCSIDLLWQWLKEYRLEEINLTLAHMERFLHPAPLSSDCRPINPKELRQIATHPLIRFGSHTMSHPWLPSLSCKEIQEEVRCGAELIQSLTGQTPLAFAYPYGAWNATVRRVISELGYIYAFTTQHPPNTESRSAADPLSYPRLCVGNWSGEELLSMLPLLQNPKSRHA
jgi:peptidoglycan/xylan/chitin deacetylase (PgdA/CDA1 family)